MGKAKAEKPAPAPAPAAAAAAPKGKVQTSTSAHGVGGPAGPPHMLNVEELIGVTFGKHLDNIVNFKMLQTVLHILARQMRLLEQQVEIKVRDDDEDKKKHETSDKKEAEKEKAAPEAKPKEKEEAAPKKAKGGKEETETDTDKDASKSKKDKRRGSIVVSDSKGVIVVEKGPPPPATPQRPRVGTIEVVTWSQFDLLDQKVKNLQMLRGPVSKPVMPSSDQLKTQIEKGTASLTDTMDAMQVDARIQAAEKAISKMAGLLTAMVVSGTVPTGRAKDIETMMGDLRELGVPIEKEAELLQQLKKPPPAPGGLSEEEANELAKANAQVTHFELSEIVKKMETEIGKNIMNITAKALTAAEQARNLAASTAMKLEVILNLNSRVDTLYSLTNDYLEQLKGFDTGFTTQLMSFQEQMQQMKSELRESLSQLDVSNNAESAALTELRQAYETLTGELDQTFQEHSLLDFTQKQLTDELKRLIEWVEMLREQKADRDEVADGLRDKADIQKLKGLLSEDFFYTTRDDLEKRIQLCYEKFQKQDSAWLRALRDLSEIAEGKAEIMQLFIMRDQTSEVLKEMSEMLQKLEILLGEPKTALLTRRLARDAECGACRVPALMTLEYVPRPASPRRARPGAADEPCTRAIAALAPLDTREHICKRWVGGSHTLLNETVKREQAEEKPFKDKLPPMKRFVGLGMDGKLYYLEEEMQPCEECRPPPVEECLDDVCGTETPLTEVGGGDPGPAATNELEPNAEAEQKEDTKEAAPTEENYPPYIN